MGRWAGSGINPLCNCLWHRKLAVKGDGMFVCEFLCLGGVGTSEASGDKCCALGGLCSSGLPDGQPRFGRSAARDATCMNDLKICCCAAEGLGEASAEEDGLNLPPLSVVHPASKHLNAKGLLGGLCHGGAF